MGYTMEGTDEDETGAPQGSVDLFMCVPEVLQPPPDADYRNFATVCEEASDSNTIGEISPFRIIFSNRGR